MISEHAPEPLIGPALRAALAAIYEAPMHGIAPPTPERLAQERARPASVSRSAGRKGAAATNRTRNLGWRKHSARRTVVESDPAMAAELARLFDAGVTSEALAERYGVDPRTIRDRLRRLGRRYTNGKLTPEQFKARLAELGDRGLAAEMGQRLHAVRVRARRMGLMP